MVMGYDVDLSGRNGTEDSMAMTKHVRKRVAVEPCLYSHTSMDRRSSKCFMRGYVKEAGSDGARP